MKDDFVFVKWNAPVVVECWMMAPIDWLFDRRSVCLFNLVDGRWQRAAQTYCGWRTRVDLDKRKSLFPIEWFHQTEVLFIVWFFLNQIAIEYNFDIWPSTVFHLDSNDDWLPVNFTEQPHDLCLSRIYIYNMRCCFAPFVRHIQLGAVRSQSHRNHRTKGE